MLAVSGVRSLAPTRYILAAGSLSIYRYLSVYLHHLHSIYTLSTPSTQCQQTAAVQIVLSLGNVLYPNMNIIHLLHIKILKK